RRGGAADPARPAVAGTGLFGGDTAARGDRAAALAARSAMAASGRRHAAADLPVDSARVRGADRPLGTPAAAGGAALPDFGPVQHARGGAVAGAGPRGRARGPRRSRGRDRATASIQ